MKLAVPKESRPGERRVAATPDNVARLLKLGFEVSVESQAGALASFTDEDYTAAGARIVQDTRALWHEADIILKVQPPDQHPALGVHEADLQAELTPHAMHGTLEQVGHAEPRRNLPGIEPRVAEREHRRAGRDVQFAALRQRRDQRLGSLLGGGLLRLFELSGGNQPHLDDPLAKHAGRVASKHRGRFAAGNPAEWKKRSVRRPRDGAYDGHLPHAAPKDG